MYTYTHSGGLRGESYPKSPKNPQIVHVEAGKVQASKQFWSFDGYRIRRQRCRWRRTLFDR